MSQSRRQFVRSASGLTLAAAAASAAPLGDIPKRKLGKTGVDVTMIGLGGARVGNMTDENEAIRVIRHAREIGIRYFDNAAAGAYGVGQRRYGTAFGKDNKDLFYTTKTRNRSYTQSELDLTQSLAHYQRDYIDLYQVHNVINQEDIDFAFGPHGVMEMIEKAKKAGKVRFVGFTGHTNPHVLRKMMEMYDWDTILMPLSVTDGARKDFSFERMTLPAAVERNLGIQAMKTTGVGAIEGEGVSSIQEALRYVWSLPISTAILGCTSIEQLETDVKIAIASEKNKMTQSEREKVQAKWANADFAKLEPWKVDNSPQSLASTPRYLGA
ncbi:MAG: hypothetical protein GC160_21810 [Acidobacteria bacterium]|nr:hypothetical protein [Acidobacteriota bacterium]